MWQIECRGDGRQRGVFITGDWDPLIYTPTTATESSPCVVAGSDNREPAVTTDDGTQATEAPQLKTSVHCRLMNKRNKSSGSNIARKVKRAYDQTWVDEAINAGCTPHQEPCQRGTFCCPASGGRFGMCHLEKDGNNRCEYVIVEAGPDSQGPVGLD
ncbi:hypothetical protein Bbelb_294410 [Branchiostoma belcheri]|nr:hypothetical protein Bbelb_294410 [Branchiostoma belcheri]